MPALRESVREFFVPFKDLDAHFALEATTGWRFIAEEISRAGLRAHLAEPADTAALRGQKRRAKTDRRDCDHMVDLLLTGRLPESWLPPEHVLEMRTLVRLRKDLVDERREWQQRIHAQLLHQGLPSIRFMTTEGRGQLAAADLSVAGRRVATIGLEGWSSSINSSCRSMRTWSGLQGSSQAAARSSNDSSASAPSRPCSSRPSSVAVSGSRRPMMRSGTWGSTITVLRVG